MTAAGLAVRFATAGFRPTIPTQPLEATLGRKDDRLSQCVQQITDCSISGLIRPLPPGQVRNDAHLPDATGDGSSLGRDRSTVRFHPHLHPIRPARPTLPRPPLPETSWLASRATSMEGRKANNPHRGGREAGLPLPPPRRSSEGPSWGVVGSDEVDMPRDPRPTRTDDVPDINITPQQHA